MVISGDVVAEAERNEERARTAQTLPGQTRSNPLAAPPPSVPVPLGGFAPPAVVSSADDEYPPLRRSGSKWPLVLGAVAVLGAGAFVVAKLGSSAPAAAPPPGDVTSPAAAPLAPDIAEPARAPEPAPAPEPAASEAPPVPEPEAAPEPVAAKPTSASKPVRKTTVAPQRRPTATKAAAPKATSASEPATQSKSKGVIVRETPF